MADEEPLRTRSRSGTFYAPGCQPMVGNNFCVPKYRTGDNPTTIASFADVTSTGMLRNSFSFFGIEDRSIKGQGSSPRAKKTEMAMISPEGEYMGLAPRAYIDSSDTDIDADAADDEISKRLSKRIFVKNYAELPEKMQKRLITSIKKEESVNEHFNVCLNILHFLEKVDYVNSDDLDAFPVQRINRKKENKDLRELALTSFDTGDVSKLFKHLELAGKGGFGSVFGCKVKRNKRVAIKVLSYLSEKQKIQCLNEIGFLMKCNHKNIVSYKKAYNHLSSQGKPEVWFLMEFLEGGTCKMASKKNKFSEKEVAYIAREMLQGISYIHSLGYVHRDLKSSNIMMTLEGEIKLIDFGLCMNTNAKTGSVPRREMCGSPFWMAPEMIQRKQHSFPVDIYAVGICCLEMINRRPPNHKSRVKAMFHAATKGMQLDRRAAKFTPEFRHFLSLCCKIEPSERATADDLLLHSFLDCAVDRKHMEDLLRRIFVGDVLKKRGLV